MDGPGRTMIIPTLGALQAHEIPETGEYPEETLDLGLMRGPLEVRSRNTVLWSRSPKRLSPILSGISWVTTSVLPVVQWPARREEVIFNEFSKHGHIVFRQLFESPVS